MTPLQYYLTKLAEEATEVAQRALKVQQFGLRETEPGNDQNNQQRLEAEFNDLLAIVELLRDVDCELRREPILIDAKKRTVRAFLNYSIDLGMVSRY